MHRDHVHIALAEDQAAPVSVLREIQREKHVPFAENRRIRRVEVLRLVVAERSAAERDHIAAQVDDREHHAAVKAVHRPAAAAFERDVGKDHFLLGKPLPLEVIHQLEAAGGRIPQAEMTDGGGLQGAAGKILPPRATLVGIQNGIEETGRFPVQGQHARAQPGHAVVHTVFRHREARALREKTDRLHIIQILDLAHEGDHVAPGAAAEAVKRAVVRVDVEGRRFFTVERTETDEVLAAALEIDILRGDLRQVAAGFQLLQKRIGQRHGKHLLRPRAR